MGFKNSFKDSAFPIYFLTIIFMLLVCLGIALMASSRVGEPDPHGEEVTVQYEGQDLHCVAWDGPGREREKVCDFVRYHEEHTPKWDGGLKPADEPLSPEEWELLASLLERGRLSEH